MITKKNLRLQDQDLQEQMTITEIKVTIRRRLRNLSIKPINKRREVRQGTKSVNIYQRNKGLNEANVISCFSSLSPSLVCISNFEVFGELVLLIDRNRDVENEINKDLCFMKSYHL